MALPTINLDDRTFEQLFQELRRRIPVYTPEWTDHNESDPGIALLQLFAWLQEMILWRLNQVPRRNFLKFMELVGIDLNPAAAARAELTFKLSTKDLKTAVTISQGTKVTLADAGDGPPVVFETDENLLAVGAEIVAVQSFDAARFELFTESNRLAGKTFAAFGAKPQREAALYLGFDRAFPEGIHRMLIHVPTATSGNAIQSRGSGLQDFSPPVTAQWEYWAGDQQGWKPLLVDRDETRSLTASGAVTFQQPVGQETRKLGLLKKPQDPALYWFRYRIAEVLGNGFETAPLIEDVLLNTVTATSAHTELDEVLGASDASPDQSFPLAHSPVLPIDDPDSIGRVAVDEGGGFEVWQEVRDFAASGRNDKHYTLNSTTGTVTFGDGTHGKIPRWLPGNGSNTPQADLRNIRATRYRWGGGARANAGANKITGLQSAVAFVDSVTNLRPAVGGADEESVDEAESRAPMTLRTGSRAVTLEDFEFLATQTPGAFIKRAQAIPLHNPNFRVQRTTAGSPQTEMPIPGTVTVVVVPQSTDPKPMPSDGTLALVGRWLDQHRLLTSELFVARPHYREVHIKAHVIAMPTASSGKLQEALKARLLAYFHPLTGGPEGKGWDFGGTIYFSETYRQILTTPGVLNIDTGSVRTYVGEAQQPPCQDIELEPDELVYSLDHEIRVTYS
jgi:hypothetical protein